MAAAKKDFSKVNTNRVYSTIAEATEEPEAMPGQLEFSAENMELSEVQTAQEITGKRKPRKTYTEQEAAEALAKLQTSGMKGVKLPRINLAFSPENYEFVRTMANVRGENLTQFINHIMDLCREENADIYKKAIEFRNSL